MDQVVQLCRQRGFVFGSSEIYNGFNGFYDYGPLGCELKKNIKDLWWRDFVHGREDVHGLDSSIIASPAVWRASGHVDGFSDPMCDDKETKKRYRADQLFVDDVVDDATGITPRGTRWGAGGVARAATPRSLPRRRRRGAKRCSGPEGVGGTSPAARGPQPRGGRRLPGVAECPRPRWRRAAARRPDRPEAWRAAGSTCVRDARRRRGRRRGGGLPALGDGAGHLREQERRRDGAGLRRAGRRAQIGGRSATRSRRATSSSAGSSSRWRSSARSDGPARGARATRSGSPRAGAGVDRAGLRAELLGEDVHEDLARRARGDITFRVPFGGRSCRASLRAGATT